MGHSPDQIGNLDMLVFQEGETRVSKEKPDAKTCFYMALTVSLIDAGIMLLYNKDFQYYFILPCTQV